LPWLLSLMVVGCGPRVTGGDHSDATSSSDPGDEANDDACGEGSCPAELFCGEEQRICEGGLAIRPCIDGHCGPSPRACVVVYQEEDTCAEVCGRVGFTCVENGCEGATAFGFPGPPERGDLVSALCGSGAESVIEMVVPISGSCEDELDYSAGFAVFQCCCDSPDD
jgi:hypothetical protein